jgi:hypothetical protein
VNKRALPDPLEKPAGFIKKTTLIIGLKNMNLEDSHYDNFTTK